MELNHGAKSSESRDAGGDLWWHTNGGTPARTGSMFSIHIGTAATHTRVTLPFSFGVLLPSARDAVMNDETKLMMRLCTPENAGTAFRGSNRRQLVKCHVGLISHQPPGVWSRVPWSAWRCQHEFFFVPIGLRQKSPLATQHRFHGAAQPSN